MTAKETNMYPRRVSLRPRPNGAAELTQHGSYVIDAVSTAALEPLKTRREVRSFLARELNALIAGLAQQDPTRALAGLTTGSDLEVIDSYRFLEALCKGLTARDASYTSVLASLYVRDLFANSLQRMTELPPDPREILHVKPAKTLDLQPLGQLSSTGRSLRQAVVLKERSTRVHVKHTRQTPALSR
jgi:hypothetical protein